MYRIQSLWDHLPNPVKFLCDAAAVVTTWTALLGMVQSIFAAVGAVASAIYLVYRLYAFHKEQKRKP